MTQPFDLGLVEVQEEMGVVPMAAKVAEPVAPDLPQEACCNK